jgi:hypothetical protein
VSDFSGSADAEDETAFKLREIIDKTHKKKFVSEAA